MRRETLLHQLSDYTSTNQTDGGQIEIIYLNINSRVPGGASVLKMDLFRLWQMPTFEGCVTE